MPKRGLGWTAVILSVLIASFWAYWGACENFHEGWYSVSVLENLLMLFFQYLSLTIAFTALSLIGLKWRLAGLILYLAAGIFCGWFFGGASFQVVGLLIVIPFAVLGLLFYFGNPAPKKLARALIVFVPLVVVVSISIPNLIRASQRMDGDTSAPSLVEGNGVSLVWAPRGPGWPDRGVSWQEARDICARLSKDGLTVKDQDLNIWRLPTAEEAVRSMMLHGENAGGIWHAESETAEYAKAPDKEAPLWDVHSKVIYYWTGDTQPSDSGRAYIVVYHGGIFTRTKQSSQAYLSFRAVKAVP
ncbi:MAG TPA: DUF1566 domain-containing protein [Clostridia bacterium]|nr:DUF1566 domain-containing protein [Clostridia bacterium]